MLFYIFNEEMIMIISLKNLVYAYSSHIFGLTCLLRASSYRVTLLFMHLK